MNSMIRVSSNQEFYFNFSDTASIHANERVYIPSRNEGVIVKTGVTILEAPDNFRFKVLPDSHFNGCTVVGGVEIGKEIEVTIFNYLNNFYINKGDVIACISIVPKYNFKVVKPTEVADSKESNHVSQKVNKNGEDSWEGEIRKVNKNGEDSWEGEIRKVNKNGEMEFSVELVEGGKIPVRSSTEAAGYDIFARLNEDLTIPAGEQRLIPGGFKMRIQKGYYGKIEARSGLAFKHGIRIGAGVIDSDFLGEIGVVFCNHSKSDYTVKNGDRVAQIIFLKHETPVLVEQKLSKTERGEGGFGSTGV